MSVDSVHRPSQFQEEEEEAPASPAVPRPRLKIRVLTSVDHIVIRTDYERHPRAVEEAYGHCKRFNTEFLMMTGLRKDMNHAFTTSGWSRFADITEPGSHHLTMEFLSTLHVETVGKETKINFRFFNEFFENATQRL